jgi:O-acetyl-ADP-ribose deacetylase (regulator of RNase III)
MIETIKGDITWSKADYICHQVNCQGKMNSGVAKAIRERWQGVYESYLSENISKSWEHMLGHIQKVPVNETQSVINMFAQNYYGYDGRRYTSYDAFWSCLGEIRAQVPKGKTIAFPRYIGCVRGGANWNVIYTMICEVLDEDYNIEFWDYDGG